MCFVHKWATVKVRHERFGVRRFQRCRRCGDARTRYSVSSGGPLPDSFCCEVVKIPYFAPNRR